MPEYKIDRDFSNIGTRNEVRMRVVDALSSEQPGTGIKDAATRYTYYVESLSDGNRIYLRRPANLHNGFDFLVCVENSNFSSPGERRRNYPTHDDIIKDLEAKRIQDPSSYNRLYTLMQGVFACSSDVKENLSSFEFDGGFSAEMLLKTMKWLFIEQDIRYWNYSGRNMLWSGIPNP